MNRKLFRILLLIIISNMINSNIFAYDKKFSIGPTFGFGIGVEARLPLRDKLFARASVIYLNLNQSLDLDYFKALKVNEKDLKESGASFVTSPISLVPICIDYHPFDNSFKFSIGAAYNNNDSSINISFKPLKGIDVGGKHYSKEELGNISGKFTWGNSIVPVFSIGYDSSFYSDSMMTFNFEIGGMYVGKSKIDVTSSGLMAKHLDNVIDEANQTLNTELEQYQKYLYIIPIIKAGIRFNF